MQNKQSRKTLVAESTLRGRYFSVYDLFVILLFVAFIYGMVQMGQEWKGEYNPQVEIDLSISSLPLYAFYSMFRGFAAYILSLFFTLVVGYVAAKSVTAERLIIPMLDILQSIPVLGFLPGLVLGLIAIFPHSSLGPEIAAILMIFTGQVWNMTFSFYASLKSIPHDYIEATQIIGFGWWDRFKQVELPYSAVNLAWNSLMSMAGGWFFLSICEAFSLGDQQFRLPGVGSYMAVAIEQGNNEAMALGIFTMTLIILIFDFLAWRPILAWVQRFKADETRIIDTGASGSEPLMRIVVKQSKLISFMRTAGSRFLKSIRRTFKLRFRKNERRRKKKEEISTSQISGFLKIFEFKFIRVFLWVFFILLAGYGAIRLIHVLLLLPAIEWVRIFRNTFWTFLRVTGVIVLSTLWTVPFGIWIGISPRRIRIAQPIIQVIASFPAPMLYPLALGIFFALGINFNISSMLLMQLGAQWYILFNVLAGAVRVPQELDATLNLMGVSTWVKWKCLYFPCVFPALATAWVTAAGGAWNATIVAEYLVYKGKVYAASGLGAMISEATIDGKFPLLAATLTIMVLVVVVLNRTLWAKVYELSQGRYRMDL